MSKTTTEQFADEPILNRAKKGLPQEVLIIDAHAHIGGWSEMFIPGAAPENAIEVMDRCGIRAMAISANLSIGPDYKAGNRHIAEAADANPGRFIGYATANPNYPTEEVEAELEYWLSHHEWMRGVKIHPARHKYPINGPRYRIAFEVANRHRVPVLSHTEGESEDALTSDPSLMAEVAEEFPDLPILLGHAGLTPPGFRSAVGVAQRFPNLYLETCSSYHAMGVIEYFSREVGADRVVFGSDAVYLNQPAELGKVVYAKLSTEEKEMILGGNAARLFGYALSALILPN
jgi:hypothetical protein